MYIDHTVKVSVDMLAVWALSINQTTSQRNWKPDYIETYQQGFKQCITTSRKIRKEETQSLLLLYIIHIRLRVIYISISPHAAVYKNIYRTSPAVSIYFLHTL
jgi:hypothetical protein